MGPSDIPNLAVATPMDAPAFDIHVRGVTQRVRSALADALASVGADATKPQSIAKQLKLDKSLAWKAAKIVTDSDPFSAIPRLPGRAGVKILLDALEAAQATDSLVTEFRIAMAEFDRMVATHAGSRETLQMMLANVSNEGQRDRDEQHRKLAFQGNSAIWGVQARVHVGLHFLAPAANQPELLDTATISGLVDFKRLRQDVPWSVAQMHMFDDGGKYVPIQGFEPLDPALGVDDPPILREFCSASLPPLRTQRTRSGPTRFQIAEGPVGITGSATCMTGWLHRATASIYATDDDTYGDLVIFMNTPSELVIHDLFVHKSMPFAHNPRTLVYSQLPGEAVYPQDGREHGILPIDGERIDLGYGLTNLTTPEVPRFRSMVEMATTQLGHHFTDFVGIRFKLRFPPIPAVGVFRFDLLKR